MNNNLSQIIRQYKEDKQSVYNTWFINNEERLKAFRSIRRGVMQVIDDIKNNRFPNDFKGSSLEFVLTCITEQKQVFEGASHPFYWKPKLRIPDIYENEINKKTFGQFLENCLNAKTEEQIIKEIIRLDNIKTKGLGPAVASILYFLHPTIIPPFNTAIINGFNFLFKDKKKLGSWSEYLKLREVMIDVLWFQKNTNNVIAAFEVEKSTSIYSGILRLTDLSYTIANGDEVLYLIVPDKREKDVCLQLCRPAMKQNNVVIKYILFSELRSHCDALCKFGETHHIMEKIAKGV